MSIDPTDWTPADLPAIAKRLPPPSYRPHTMRLTVRQQDEAGEWTQVSHHEVTAAQGDSTQALAFSPCTCPRCSAPSDTPTRR